jgi:hypothetical protein
MNIKRLAFDAALALTTSAAIYATYKYDQLHTATKKALLSQQIWDACKDKMMKDIDAALAFHTTGLVDIDMPIKLRAATLRNRVYECCNAKNETLRSEVEQEIQSFGKNGN